MDEYRPPESREEAREHIDYARRFIKERTEKVGAERAGDDLVTVTVLQSVMDGYEYLAKNGG